MHTFYLYENFQISLPKFKRRSDHKLKAFVKQHGLNYRRIQENIKPLIINTRLALANHHIKQYLKTLQPLDYAYEYLTLAQATEAVIQILQAPERTHNVTAALTLLCEHITQIKTLYANNMLYAATLDITQIRNILDTETLLELILERTLDKPRCQFTHIPRLLQKHCVLLVMKNNSSDA